MPAEANRTGKAAVAGRSLVFEARAVLPKAAELVTGRHVCREAEAGTVKHAAAAVDIEDTLGTRKGILRLGNQLINGTTGYEALAQRGPTARRVTAGKLDTKTAGEPMAITKSEGRTQSTAEGDEGVKALQTAGHKHVVGREGKVLLDAGNYICIVDVIVHTDAASEDTHGIVVDAGLAYIIVAVDAQVELTEKAQALCQGVAGVEAQVTAKEVVLGNTLLGYCRGTSGNRLTAVDVRCNTAVTAKDRTGIERSVPAAGGVVAPDGVAEVELKVEDTAHCVVSLVDETAAALPTVANLDTVVLLVAEIVKAIVELGADTEQREGLVLQAETSYAVEHRAAVVDTAVENVAGTAGQREGKAGNIGVRGGTGRGKVGVAVLDTHSQRVAAVERIVLSFFIRIVRTAVSSKSDTGLKEDNLALADVPAKANRTGKAAVVLSGLVFEARAVLPQTTKFISRRHVCREAEAGTAEQTAAAVDIVDTLGTTEHIL